VYIIIIITTTTTTQVSKPEKLFEILD